MDNNTHAIDSSQNSDRAQNEATKLNEQTGQIIVPENEHALQNAWTFWFVRRVQGARNQENYNYEQNIKKVVTFASAEGFWRHYNHLLRPNDLPITSDYHLFKETIKPLWEDDANKHGGKWIVRLRKGLASRCWEDLILAVIGEQFDVGDEICGVVISIRFQEDILSVWSKTAGDREAKTRIFEKLKAILNIPNITMEYKAHDASIRDQSSFRNPDQVASVGPPNLGPRSYAPREFMSRSETNLRTTASMGSTSPTGYEAPPPREYRGDRSEFRHSSGEFQPRTDFNRGPRPDYSNREQYSGEYNNREYQQREFTPRESGPRGEYGGRGGFNRGDYQQRERDEFGGERNFSNREGEFGGNRRIERVASGSAITGGERSYPRGFPPKQI